LRKRVKVEDEQKGVKGLDMGLGDGYTDDETYQADDDPFVAERPVTPKTPTRTYSATDTK
jgi:hypothetical protein